MQSYLLRTILHAIQIVSNAFACNVICLEYFCVQYNLPEIFCFQIEERGKRKRTFTRDDLKEACNDAEMKKAVKKLKVMHEHAVEYAEKLKFLIDTCNAMSSGCEQARLQPSIPSTNHTDVAKRAVEKFQNTQTYASALTSPLFQGNSTAPRIPVPPDALQDGSRERNRRDYENRQRGDEDWRSDGQTPKGPQGAACSSVITRSGRQLGYACIGKGDECEVGQSNSGTFNSCGTGQSNCGTREGYGHQINAHFWAGAPCASDNHGTVYRDANACTSNSEPVQAIGQTGELGKYGDTEVNFSVLSDASGSETSAVDGAAEASRQNEWGFMQSSNAFNESEWISMDDDNAAGEPANAYDGLAQPFAAVNESTNAQQPPNDLAQPFAAVNESTNAQQPPNDLAQSTTQPVAAVDESTNAQQPPNDLAQAPSAASAGASSFHGPAQSSASARPASTNQMTMLQALIANKFRTGRI